MNVPMGIRWHQAILLADLKTSGKPVASLLAMVRTTG